MQKYLLKTFLLITILLTGLANEAQAQKKQKTKLVKKTLTKVKTKWPKQYWDTAKISNFISFVQTNGIYQNGSYTVHLDNDAILAYNPQAQTIAVDSVVVYYKMDKYFNNNSIDGKLFASIPFMTKNHYVKNWISLALDDVSARKAKVTPVISWRNSPDPKDSLLDVIRHYIETHGIKLLNGYVYQANGLTFQYDVSEKQTSFFIRDANLNSMELVVNNTSTVENTGWVHYKNGGRKIAITDLESVYHGLIPMPQTTDTQVKKQL